MGCESGIVPLLPPPSFETSEYFAWRSVVVNVFLLGCLSLPCLLFGFFLLSSLVSCSSMHVAHLFCFFFVACGLKRPPLMSLGHPRNPYLLSSLLFSFFPMSSSKKPVLSSTHFGMRGRVCVCASVHVILFVCAWVFFFFGFVAGVRRATKDVVIYIRLNGWRFYVVARTCLCLLLK